ncbi:MAG: 3-deoxy-manno-octulosonate cytidylyltransferase, partial [Thermoanaerobaculia bacterium]
PMIWWVWEKARRVKGAEVLVATDSKEIYRVVENFGGKAVMTSKRCPSGTDRIAEVAKKYKAQYYINLQGDEPLIKVETLKKFNNTLLKGFEMATMDFPLDEGQAQDPNVVKVVKDKKGFALYFSRAPIPYPRNKGIFRKHIGIYGYKRETLLKFVKLKKAPLEEAEGLEQLRALYNGIKIYVTEAPYDSISVDTPEDALRVEEILKKEGI